MKPHPRVRKTIKWGGAVVTVVLLVVWIGSGWVFLSLATQSRKAMFVYDGQISLQTSARVWPDAPYEWHRRPSPKWSLWGWEFRTYGPSPFGNQFPHSSAGHWLTAPLWPFVLVMAAATGWAWRLDVLARGRARMGICSWCGYDRTGLAPAAVCPECGTLSKS